MDAFYVTLPSNTPFDGNTTGDYTVPLPYPIELTGRWEMGVSQLIMPVSFNTLDGATLSIELVKYNPTDKFYRHTEKLQLPAGHYDNVQALLDALNELMYQFWSNTLAEFKMHYKSMLLEPMVTAEYANKAMADWEDGDEIVAFELVSGRVELRMDNDLVARVHMSEALQYTLGFKQDQIKFEPDVGLRQRGGYSILRGEYGADIRSGTDCFYLYCDAASPQFIGHIKAQVIKVVPAVGKYGSILDKVYHSVDYCDLLRNRFDAIHVYIKTSDGRSVSFDFGKVIVKLHFRRKRAL